MNREALRQKKASPADIAREAVDAKVWKIMEPYMRALTSHDGAQETAALETVVTDLAGFLMPNAQRAGERYQLNRFGGALNPTEQDAILHVSDRYALRARGINTKSDKPYFVK